MGKRASMPLAQKTTCDIKPRENTGSVEVAANLTAIRKLSTADHARRELHFSSDSLESVQVTQLGRHTPVLYHVCLEGASGRAEDEGRKWVFARVTHEDVDVVPVDVAAAVRCEEVSVVLHLAT